MVKCPNCNNVVQDGKFCEKCGSSLEGAVKIDEMNSSENLSSNYVCPSCGHSNAGGKFCEKCGTSLTGGSNPNANSSIGGAFSGFLNKAKDSVNKAATDLMAIKSDFSNGTLICKISKIPNVQEKKIKIDAGEVVFYNNGTGFTKHDQTYTTNDNDFLCFYVRNITTIQNTINVDIKAPIKNLNDEDLITAKATYNLELASTDVDSFFNSFMAIKQDTWKMIDINSMLSTSLNKIVNENTINMLKTDGNIDLRDVKGQINKFVEDIKNLINNDVSKYGLKVNNLNLFNVETNMQEINQILIKNLYKDFNG